MENKWSVLSPEKGNFMFGYYDRFAIEPDGFRHLSLKIPQQTRLPEKGEKAEVGYIDIREKVFVRCAETESWCHQQGAMTLWLPHLKNHFVYNDFVATGSEWRPLARICDSSSGKIIGEYTRPIYVISRDGKWGASLDFARIPRRGYSYARAEVPLDKPMPDLDNDGLFLINMLSGESKLIAPYRNLLKAHPCPYDLDDQYIWLNHAIFNADSTRLMVLLRHRQDPHKGMWKTHMITMNLDGSEVLCPLPEMLWSNAQISHQMWGRGTREVLVDANWCGRGHEYVVFEEDKIPLRASRIHRGMGPMGHLIFSPDGKWLAADTYPKDGMQKIALVEVSTGELTEIGRFNHPAVPIGEVRCDLHPRWSADSRYITIDTIHFGERKIALFDIRTL